MNVLLDTNAYVALKRGQEGAARVVRRASRVFLSAVVAGELLHGFRQGSRWARNRADLESFLASPYVGLLPVTLDTADRYGRVAAELRRKGTPIPTNDVWIAAHALESGADLLSFDRHFAHVEGVAWVHPDEA